MQILSLYLQGLSQSDVAKRLGIAQSTVSLEVSRFIEEAKASLEDAFKKYGIKEQLASLHYVAGQALKAGLTIPRCLKALSLMERLEGLGRSLNELDGMFKLYDRAGGDPTVLEGGVRLLKLESEAGKPYPELLKDYEHKVSEVEELNRRLIKLKEALLKTEAELKDVQRRLLTTTQELKASLHAKDRLAKLGLERVNELAKFIEDYEALGFDAVQVKALAEWREVLVNMGIDPKDASKIKELQNLASQLEKIERIVLPLKRLFACLDSHGQYRMDHCIHNMDGYCKLWTWKSPPTHITNEYERSRSGGYHIKASSWYCALCHEYKKR